MKTNNILIVGGGTAGYISALILKARYGENISIKIVKSNKVGIIGVGEGSTEHWKSFMDYVNIDFKDIIRECDATLKCGIMFQNWTKDDYLHNVGSIRNIKIGQHYGGYLKHIAEESKTSKLNDPWFWENKINKSFVQTDMNKSPTNQFHFNTYKLNKFLHNKSIERGIIVIEDEIKNIDLNDNGEIINLKGEKDNYTSNFYIDCTGFKRLLISKLGAKWQSYNKYLKMKEAIAFPTGDTNEYNTYTIARAMNYGWIWHIPTYGRWGNGYIFDSDYINADQAKQEVEKYIGHEIEVGKHIKFDPGCLDKTWIKNCMAVGLSANFVEPLEATSIGTSINQMFLFTHMFDNYNQKTIDEYNNKMNIIMNNIRDFIVLHYITKREDTNFWKDLKIQEIPDTLKENLEKWKTRLPILEDFKHTNFYLFFENNYTQILYALSLLNIDNIKNQYKSYNKNLLKFIDEQIEKYEKQNSNNHFISHKTYLDIIRATNA